MCWTDESVIAPMLVFAVPIVAIAGRLLAGIKVLASFGTPLDAQLSLRLEKLIGNRVSSEILAHGHCVQQKPSFAQPVLGQHQAGRVMGSSSKRFSCRASRPEWHSVLTPLRPPAASSKATSESPPAAEWSGTCWL